MQVISGEAKADSNLASEFHALLKRVEIQRDPGYEKAALSEKLKEALVNVQVGREREAELSQQLHEALFRETGLKNELINAFYRIHALQVLVF